MSNNNPDTHIELAPDVDEGFTKMLQRIENNVMRTQLLWNIG